MASKGQGLRGAGRELGERCLNGGEATIDLGERSISIGAEKCSIVQIRD